MNKQEIIDYLKRQIEWSGNHNYSLVNRAELISMIEQLDEPQKVKVPVFVAEWFETNKYVLDQAILDYMFEDYASDKSEFGKWFDKKNSKPIEILVRMLDGYEIEEEPLWVIEYQEKYLNDIQFKKRLHNLIVEADGVWGSKNRAMRFTSEKQAERILFLCGGTVEKV